jgi:hypothetical protein
MVHIGNFLRVISTFDEAAISAKFDELSSTTAAGATGGADRFAKTILVGGDTTLTGSSGAGGSLETARLAQMTYVPGLCDSGAIRLSSTTLVGGGPDRLSNTMLGGSFRVKGAVGGVIGLVMSILPTRLIPGIPSIVGEESAGISGGIGFLVGGFSAGFGTAAVLMDALVDITMVLGFGLTALSSFGGILTEVSFL